MLALCITTVKRKVPFLAPAPPTTGNFSQCPQRGVKGAFGANVSRINVSDGCGGVLMMLTAVLMPAAEGGFTALNPETGTASQGETLAEALDSLREATELYLEEFPLKPTGSPLVTSFQVGARAA